MGKKNTCKMNKIPETKLKCYDIAVMVSGKTHHIDVMVSSIETDGENLIALKDEEIVGQFKDWIYYVRIDEEDDTEECVTKEKVSLPEDFGKVNGQKF